MSTPFVSFPNTATDYVFTNDVNLMDADSSHLYQSQGEWTNLGSTVTRAADAEGRYGYVMELLSGGVGARMRFGPGSPSVASELVAVPSLTEITLTGRVPVAASHDS